MNYNINDYEVNDLIKFIELDKKKISIDLITNTLINIKKRIFLNHSENNTINNNDMINFLRNVGIKLYLYYGFGDKINNFISIYDNYEKTISNNNVIIQPFEKKSILNVINSDYETGNINPIQRKTTTICINIDSYFRNDNNEMTNSFTYTFDTPLKNIISYNISSLELPSTWYDISVYKKNNQFTIITYNHKDNSDNDVSSTTHIINLPEGNYSLSELKTYINNYFLNVGNGLNYLIFDIDEITLKTIIRANNVNDGSTRQPYNPINVYYNTSFYFELYFDLEEDINIRNLLNSIKDKDECELSCEEKKILNLKIRDFKKNFGYLIGFTEPYYKVDISNIRIEQFKYNIEYNFKGFLESENVFGETIDKYILLYIDDFNKNTKENLISNNDFNKANIIGKIPITSQSFTVINQNSNVNIFKEKIFFGPVNIKKLKIQLLNKYGDLIDTKNNNYSFTIEFKQIYS